MVERPGRQRDSTASGIRYQRYRAGLLYSEHEHNEASTWSSSPPTGAMAADLGDGSEERVKQLLFSWSIGIALAALSACGGSSGVEPAAQPGRSSPTVYVTNEGSGDMTVIDAGSNAVIATIPLGKRPRGIQLSPDKQKLYIALSGSPFAGPGVDRDTLPPADKEADGIGVFDIGRNKLDHILGGGSDPEQLAVSADGGKLYIANEDEGLASVLDIAGDRILKTLPVGKEPEGVAISPDGSTVYVTSESNSEIFVIDTAGDTILKSFKVGYRPRAAAFSPDGSRAYITSESGASVAVVDTAGHEVIHTIEMKGENVRPMGVVVSPDGKRFYVSTGRGRMIVAFDAASYQELGSVEVGIRPWGIAITPDGKTLYTANGPSNDVSVVDLATLTVVAKIPAGDLPWGVAIAP